MLKLRRMAVSSREPTATARRATEETTNVQRNRASAEVISSAEAGGEMPLLLGRVDHLQRQHADAGAAAGRAWRAVSPRALAGLAAARARRVARLGAGSGARGSGRGAATGVGPVARISPSRRAVSSDGWASSWSASTARQRSKAWIAMPRSPRTM
jgi:hypothetical protein